MYDTSRVLPLNLVLAGDAAGNGPRVTMLFDFLAARGYQDLRIENLNYNYGHVGMDRPAFIDALTFILAKP